MSIKVESTIVNMRFLNQRVTAAYVNTSTLVAVVQPRRIMARVH